MPLRPSALAAAAFALATAAAGRPAFPVRFVDVTRPSGVTFVHDAAKTSEKLLPETMGAGVLLLDHDGDGDLDLYFVQGGSARADAPRAGRENELWSNEGGFRFRRVAAAAGAGDDGLGMGACAGDVDSDGDTDLVVTNVGPSVLYLNRGGTFLRGELPGSDAWGASCTFFDAEGDGDLDLYATRYVDFHPVTKNPYCGDVRAGQRAYCHPDVFTGVRDSFWRNDGTGRFTDATAEAGLLASSGKGLGVVATDYDGDGDTDLYVANDSTPNFLWRNDGAGRFEDVAMRAGCALDENGAALAGMGLVAADLDGDTRTDLLVTNLDLQTNTFYRAAGDGRFEDRTVASGIAATDHGHVGFGIEAFDADYDGDLDLYLANGHIIDNISFFNASLAHAQPDQLLENLGGGRFRELGPEAGDVGRTAMVARGTASGDLDGDGDLDLVVTVNDGPARLYRNDGGSRRPHLVLELRGTKCHRDAIGARAEVFAKGATGGLPHARGEVQGGRSYLGQGTLRLHLACPAQGADVRVTWPGGRVEWWRALPAFAQLRLVEGRSGDAPAKLAEAVTTSAR